MLYIAPNADKYSPIIIVKDTEDKDYELQIPQGEFWQALKDLHIVPQTILGVFKYKNNVQVTPVTPLELSVMKLLSNPHFYVGDKLGDSGATPYKSYGLYNIGVGGEYYGQVPEGRSIARLLLDTCGDVWQAENAKSRIETTREYIAVCVDDQPYQSLYLRFDIDSYEKIQRSYIKYKMMDMSSIMAQSKTLTVVDE